jgi:hypothetical protein
LDSKTAGTHARAFPPLVGLNEWGGERFAN